MKRFGVRKALIWLFTFAVVLAGWSAGAQNLSVTPNDVQFRLSLEGGDFSTAVRIFLLMTVLSIVPSLVLMMTSYLRISIVLGLLKQAMGTQQVPGPKTIGALTVFLTIFVMQPVWRDIYSNAIEPYSEKRITEKEAMEKATVPIKYFMIKQTRESSLLLFMELGNMEPVASPRDLPIHVVIPAFMLSELKTAFQMAFLIYLPFLVIDVVVAVFLMSMGMMMLPPMMISLPFKLLLFVVVNGWELVIRSLVSSFK